MKRIIYIIYLLMLTGCSTIMNGPTQDIVVTSNPPGATITPTDYKYWVKTPGIITLDRTNNTVLTARLYGYEDAKQEIKCGISPWILCNYSLTLTIIDLSTGSIGNLSPTKIHFELIPKNVE